MRFSSIFQPNPPAPRKPQVDAAAHEEPVQPAPASVSATAADLPDDLDARVRLVGEWQLLEG